jgi:hypothetical protein
MWRRWGKIRSAPKSALDDFKSSTPSKNQVAQRNTDVLVDDFAMSFRGVIVTEHFHGTNDLDSGGVSGDNDNALLVVGILVVGIALSHNEVQLGAGVAGTADPPVYFG